MRHRDDPSQDTEKDREDRNAICWKMEKIHLFLQLPHSHYFLGLFLFPSLSLSLPLGVIGSISHCIYSEYLFDCLPLSIWSPMCEV